MTAAAVLTVAATIVVGVVEYARMAIHRARTRRALARIGWSK